MDHGAIKAPSEDAWPEALDAMTAAPGHHRVILENERVRVLDSWIAPGDTVPVHTHRWPSVIHVVSASDFVRYDAEGRVVLDSRTLPTPPAAGDVLWSPPLKPHSLHNAGATDLRVITVELKDAPRTEGGG
jgi:quercetin dioxygenase-like cupin family protein